MADEITRHDDGTISITGPNATAAAQVHARVGALCLSITVGGRPGLMSPMADQCGSAKRTKRGVLEDYVLWFYGQGGKLTAQWVSVARALGEDRAAKLRRKAEKLSR